MSAAGEDPVVSNGDRPRLSDQGGSEGRGEGEGEEKDAAAGAVPGAAGGGDYDDHYDPMAEDGEHDRRAVGPRLSLEDRQSSSQGAAGVASRDDGVVRGQDDAGGRGEGRGQAEDSDDASRNARSGNGGGGGGGGGQGGKINLSGLARRRPPDDTDDVGNTDGDVAAAAGAGAGAAVVRGQGEMGEEFQADEEAVPPSSEEEGSRAGDPAAGLGEWGREEGRGGGEGGEVSTGGSISNALTEEVVSSPTLDSMSSNDHLPWLEPSEVMRHIPSMEGRDRETQAVIDALQEVYREKLKPIEQLSMLGKFHYDVMVDAELQAKPQVLLLGHYSTGKTSMIRHFIGRDFPGMHIGPEPSPGVFQVVMAGTAQRSVKGSALCILDELPYASLGKFGAQFLGKFQASIVPSPLLEHVTFVDTPGIVSPGKHGTSRGFPFPEVVKWFAERSDLILLVFDAHKLDMGKEFREVMSVIAQHGDRVRVVLNKGQEVDSDRLMKVYGALMWSIGRCLGGKATAPRVYVGSFWEGPRRHPDDSPEDDDDSFDRDEAALLKEIMDLPKNVGVRKINDMMQRAKVVKIHLLLVYAIRARMPRLWGTAVAQDRILLSLEDVFEEVKKKEGILQADMPDVEEYRHALRRIDLRDLPRRNRRLLATMDDIIDRDIKQCVTRAGGVRRIYKLDPAAGVEDFLRPPSNSRRRATMGGGGARGGVTGSLGAALFPGRSSIAGGGDGRRRRRRRASMRGRTEEWSDSSGGLTPEEDDEGEEEEEEEEEEGDGGLALAGSGSTGVGSWLLFGGVLTVLVVLVGVAVGLSKTGVLPELPELPGWLLSLKPRAFEEWNI